MYSLIDVDPNKEYGVARVPEWKAVRDGLQRNLLAMLQHYRHLAYAVAPDHLLVQLLQSINVPLSMNSDRYYSNISLNALAVANTFQLTTPFGEGKVFRGVFFHKGVSEVILAFDEAFDYERVEKEWQHATPVRVLRHPFTDVVLRLPNGRFANPQSGIAVIAVNAALLAFQYRAFARSEQQLQKVDPSYTQKNLMQFVHMYVLPNMLESYLDYALFNRVNHLLLDLPMSALPSREAVHLPNYTRQVDYVLNKVLGLLAASEYTAPASLAAIPAVTHPDLRAVMYVPDVVPTRQILWSVILARLPMLLFLIRVTGHEGRVSNQTGLAGVAVMLSRFKRQRVFDAVLPKELYQPTMDAIDEIVGAL